MAASGPFLQLPPDMAEAFSLSPFFFNPDPLPNLECNCCLSLCLLIALVPVPSSGTSSASFNTYEIYTQRYIRNIYIYIQSQYMEYLHTIHPYILYTTQYYTIHTLYTRPQVDQLELIFILIAETYCQYK